MSHQHTICNLNLKDVFLQQCQHHLLHRPNSMLKLLSVRRYIKFVVETLLLNNFRINSFICIIHGHFLVKSHALTNKACINLRVNIWGFIKHNTTSFTVGIETKAEVGLLFVCLDACSIERFAFHFVLSKCRNLLADVGATDNRLVKIQANRQSAYHPE
jgi:hypothetical protein